jgi:hypothetical protein
VPYRPLCVALALTTACGGSSSDVQLLDARLSGDAAAVADARPADAPASGGFDAPVGGQPDATGGGGGVDAPVGGGPDAPVGGGPDAGGTGEPVTAFRVSELILRDPHAFILGCIDVTDPPGFFTISVNGIIDEMLNDDGDDDDLLDLSLILLMTPLDVAAGATTDAELVLGECSAPASSSSCAGAPDDPRFAAIFDNQGAGTCLGAIPGTASSGQPYNDGYAPIGATTATAGQACGASRAGSLTLNVAGALIELEDAQIAARYVEDGLAAGLIRGFISEADAEATTIPTPIGNLTVSSLFWGGSDNGCDVQGGDPTPGDIDVGPDGVTTGWWIYLNFTADEVPYTEE